MKNFHLCKEDYEEVKQRLSMRRVAEHYGYPVSRSGTCLCPFHKDGHPSLKIYENDKGFYCFSCGSGGDVIKFISMLCNLRNEEACRKLIEDFSLPVKLEELSYGEQRERQKRQEKYRKLKQFKDEAFQILSGYRKLLCDSIHNFADPHFEEALQELTIIDYRLECLKECPEEYCKDRKAVKRIGEIHRRIIEWND